KVVQYGGADGDLAVSAAGVATATLVATGLDLVIPDPTSPALTLPQSAALTLCAVAAVLGGVPAAGTPGTVVVRDLANGTNRLTIGVDGQGNRTTLTINPP